MFALPDTLTDSYLPSFFFFFKESKKHFDTVIWGIYREE